ncbi:hypothetical protein FA13DRAFT_595366 [Coprinellus micaceus]|uniref:Uncharacterized protein n=1 Tax=Coprinellus micaceus TaxID=71717 RepID=A0A4Y7T6H8_COPMI|nr:hypothetical protein FA13DRAFT_595366 [Coprinellus micaceus]
MEDGPRLFEPSFFPPSTHPRTRSPTTISIVDHLPTFKSPERQLLVTHPAVSIHGCPSPDICRRVTVSRSQLVTRL